MLNAHFRCKCERLLHDAWREKEERASERKRDLTQPTVGIYAEAQPSCILRPSSSSRSLFNFHARPLDTHARKRPAWDSLSLTLTIFFFSTVLIFNIIDSVSTLKRSQSYPSSLIAAVRTFKQQQQWPWRAAINRSFRMPILPSISQ